MPGKSNAEGAAPPSGGLRERKQRETRQRIAEAALRLFLSEGYERTTLDAIAAAAGISRRTFFSYFKSKDDIILFGMEADWAELIAELLKTSPDVPPLDAVQDVMVRRIARYTTEEMAAIDHLMLSSASLLARKQASYAKQEQALFLALCEVWRQPERQTALRMVAMASIGAMRLALQAWREQTGRRKPPAQFLRDAFESLRAGL
ncbi:TetR/AcrR family transcriptional regulator [Pseudoxanthomonas winnipegensis]|jgi:AcrR family transcriptional regulator|uniref:TetR family transcriptional regulator n=1 Tax=Pseudoxanthomonas winnipegensis TaxID=2480810 RepID=A0A4Q8LDW9_9GAMM|nr:TetR/AcrR family transcriptional regulator [Pseudoxanthomonas winnipegensis]TAA27118.1 TetR family transcriptional regulator [Pseudoxanthomonas winnipegensis]